MTVNVDSAVGDDLRPVDVIEASPMPISGLIQLINGHYVAQVIYVFAHFAIADQLAQQPLTSSEVAFRLATDKASTERLLRVVERIGLVCRIDERYHLTDVGEFLRSDVVGSLHSFALLQGAPWRWAPLGRMTEAMRTGAPQFAAVHGQGYYEFLETYHEHAAIFQAAMSNLAASGQVVAAAAHDFEEYSTVYDIGGGDGTVLKSILSSYPSINGHFLDRAYAIGKATATFESAQMLDRVTFHEVDFMQQIPVGGDCYLLSDILCDCDEAAASTLLTRCAEAMGDHTTLVILDQILPTDTKLHHADYLDLEEMVFTGGLARTAEQWDRLFRDNGLYIKCIEDNIIPLMDCIVVRKS